MHLKSFVTLLLLGFASRVGATLGDSDSNSDLKPSAEERDSAQFSSTGDSETLSSVDSDSAEDKEVPRKTFRDDESDTSDNHGGKDAKKAVNEEDSLSSA